jgi:hypothetical protein
LLDKGIPHPSKWGNTISGELNREASIAGTTYVQQIFLETSLQRSAVSMKYLFKNISA